MGITMKLSQAQAKYEADQIRLAKDHCSHVECRRDYLISMYHWAANRPTSSVGRLVYKF